MLLEELLQLIELKEKYIIYDYYWIISGATSFDCLKFVNGIRISSLSESTFLYGLLKGDNYLMLYLEEAYIYIYIIQYTLHRSFTTLSAYCEPYNPKYCEYNLKVQCLKLCSIKYEFSWYKT